MSDTGELLRKIEARLDQILDPCSVAMRDPMGLMEMGLVDDIALDANGRVTINMCLTDTACVHFNGITAYINDALISLPGVSEVCVGHTSDTIWTDERIRRRVS